MHRFFSWVNTHQQKVALIIGYILVATLFYTLGTNHPKQNPPQITVEEPMIDVSTLNNTENVPVSQSSTDSQESSENIAGETLDCTGMIKGNISSSGKIYHIPGGAFYNRTIPELCFTTEAEAQSAGFRKSMR